MEALVAEAVAAGVDILTADFAAQLDAAEPSATRAEFCIPPTASSAKLRSPGSECVYLCGNSLGLQPKRTRACITEELDKWAELGVEGHFRTERPWVSIEDTVAAGSAALVGALPSEVVVMNSLTVNLHLLMVPFYRPTATRFRILTEAHAFPSDTYAVKSQIIAAGLDPKDALVEVAPQAGEECLRTEDVLAAIAAAGNSLALVLFSGVQYYTGQAFDIAAITAAGHAVGARVGVDLAHAIGNVPLRLHDWGVDFAAWCSYKYLNAGPGGIAGAFLHERWAATPAAELPTLSGWWGSDRATRFRMSPDFEPAPGAARLQLSNPPVLQTAALRASLAVFEEAGGVPALRRRSLGLTGYLSATLAADPLLRAHVRVLTPADPGARGCQLTLALSDEMPVRRVHEALGEEGVIVDVRAPHALRVAPVPLYNTAADVQQFAVTLRAALRAQQGQ